MFLISFEFVCKEKKSRFARKTFLKISHFLIQIFSCSDSHIFFPMKIMTCLRANEMRNSTVKWHAEWRAATSKKSIIILLEPTHTLEPSNRHFAHSTSVVVIVVTHRHAMPFHSNMNGQTEARERDDNKLFWYFLFTSTAFSCVQFYGISGSASWCDWVVDIMSKPDVVHYRTRNLFIEFLTLRLSTELMQWFTFVTFALVHFTTLSNFFLLSIFLFWLIIGEKLHSGKLRCWYLLSWREEKLNFAPRLSLLESRTQTFAHFHSLTTTTW